ncbi:phosphoribosyltransferase [Comamonas thiooxydans]|uniref:phosphoribosyltransferase n=1 Tax=Comamonas thiooxydans TaxID=363952 RepID=UPI00211576D2|nr:phosphoribosyltransferase [Comamonas thiooxydans]UUE94474.1 phosphoribosyltransferase [Comamonas thiooxydans]
MTQTPLKPFQGELDKPGSVNQGLKPFDGALDGESASRGLKGWAQDAAATGVKAALAVPEAAIGLADLVSGGKAGKVLEGAGVRFKEAREIAEGWHSDVTKAQKAEFQNADGVAGKAAVALSNPSLIAMAVGESLGAMGAGGAIGRGAMAATRLGQMGAKGAAIAGAAGEGVVGAGSAAEQIRQETADGELTAKQVALAAGTGLATGALGFAGNKVANRLGIGDADMMLAQGTKGMAKDAAERATAAAVNPLAQPAQKSILRQMGEGAITEGVLEELPQSVSEQILQNEALGKSWSEGLDDAIVMGILSGGAMGAGAAGYRGFKDKQIGDAAANDRSAAANAPGATPGQDQAAGAVPPAAWTTSAGAAAKVEPGTAPASPANAPNLDYETLPGAAPEAIGKEIPFEREFDTGGLSLQSTQPAAVPPVLDHDALRDKAGVMMPPQLDSGRIEVETGLQPLSNEQPPRQWDTGNLSLVGEGQPQAPLSQRMGLDPKAGALSKAAAMAVDSGASPVLQPQAAPVLEQQQAAPQVPAGVDPDTGEVSLQAQMDELKSRIAFMNQQGATQGWDGNRAAQRNALQTQLTRLELQAAGGQGRGASTAGAPAPVQLTGIYQILAKQVPDMSEQELQQAIAHYGPNHKRTKKLEKALQALAQKPLTAIESGANGNVSEADQTQQGSAQPAQAGAAQAGQDADQGVGNGTTPTANPGTQEQGASLAKAQAQVSEAAGAAQAAVGKAAQIAREGNAEREAQRQRQLDASERWTLMTTAERQAVAATAPGLNAIARKNVHTRAWPDIGEKIREKLLDSLVAPLVEPTAKAPTDIESAASPEPNAVSGDALPKPAAQPVGDEKPFAAETGTLGIPRAEMPQVPTANHGGLVKHLKAQGIAHETTTVDAAQLKPTQAEYSPSKVEAAKTATGDRAVIVSSDGHIIDGHHQAVAAAEEGKQVKAIVLDAPVEQALAAVKASPSANTEAATASASEPVREPKSVPERMKEAKAAKLAASAAAKPKSVPEKMREAAAARAEKPAFRRDAADTATGADFDVTSFLQSMDEGQPTAAAAAPAPTTNVRPSYSLAARAEAVRAVKGTADAIRKAWANGPEVIVAFDMQDTVVPESARRADLKQRSGGARGAPEGFYYQGKVYLMASKLKTPNDAARVLFHEALGHHGLRGLFGKDLGLILNQVATMRKVDVDAKIAEYGLRRVNRLDRRTAAEEVLAEMAQNTPQIGFVRRAVAAIRTWLRTNVPGFKSLALTDDELIRNFILPARAWVERGTVADMAQDIAFSRTSATSMPDAIIGSTLGSASSHPDYAAAKGGDIEAAVRLAMDLVTPDLVAKVKAAIGDSKPLVVPVAAEEASGRNKIPRAAAEVLAHRLGLKAANGIVQANRARRTGMDGLDRIFAPVDFAGVVEPKPYLLVDDTLTQGGTFAALASHIREGGGTVAGVIALTGKQYSAKIQPSPETLASLRQKHGDLENEYRAATGYGFDALTESEARYLARYEPADRLRDRISDEGRRGREREDQSNPGQADPDADEGLRFSRSRLSEIRDSALDQLSNAFTHEGKVSLWDKSVGTMRHLAERAPSFKPVYESAQQNIDDVSMLANDAADMAPRILPRVESLGDLKKKPVSAADNKAVARPLFEGTLIWARDENGKPTLVDDLQKRYANLSAHNKAAMLLKHGKIKSEVLAMWQGLPVAQFEKLINSRFENKMLKPGIVWSDAELQAQFGTDANQISLYREARAAIDRSIDMTARTDMLRVVGEKYEPMRDAVLAQPSVEAAAQMLLDTLEQDAKADPDSRERLAGYMQLINRRLDTAVDLQQGGYAPLSRFGRYTVDVVDANGERLYFGMYETARDSNRAKMQLEHEFKGATVTTGTMSAEAYKLFAGVTPETLEQFGEMLGLKSEGNEAQDKAFQEFLKLTKNNHSAMKRLIYRKGIAGFSEDVGRVVANFVYSNARAGAMGLNAGKMETAIGKIPKEQGELKDLAMGLRDYIRDPQEEGQAVRGMLFAQYLGGSIASAFVNTTQPFAVTLPWLSQYGGMKKAGAQLARALKDMGRSVADKGFKYESDLAKALQSAEDDGVVSPQEIHQLMAQARGAGMLRSGDGTKAGDLRAKAGNLWEQGKVLWGQPFALAEQFNRRSTFIASYRIAKDQGMADPAAFARKAVLETQFVYSKANKPKWARGAVGGTLFTFKTYSVSYLELMQRMWNQGPAGSPERVAGRRAVGWAVAMLLLMSGAGGVPFMEDAEDLIDGAGQMMGYNISAKQWRKELLANVVGKELGEFLEQGLSGLPGAPIDVSGRLGMGNLLPGTGLFLEKPNRERDMTEIIGPAGDLVARGFSGARDVIKGVVNGDVATAGKGVLEWAPTAVRNLAKGADMAATGMYRDTKGYKVIDTTLAEAAAKAIGFQPKSVAEVQEANSFMQRSKSFYTQTSSEIKAQWADALFRKDEAAVQRVRERLADWNRDNPDQPIVVKMPDVWKRVREMGKDRSDRIADTAPKALREQMRSEVALLRS